MATNSNHRTEFDLGILKTIYTWCVFESRIIFITNDFLSILQSEYDKCRKLILKILRKLTFSSFCLASLMTLRSSSFFVLVYDFVIDGDFSVLCLALILRRAIRKRIHSLFIFPKVLLIWKQTSISSFWESTWTV